MSEGDGRLLRDASRMRHEWRRRQVRIPVSSTQHAQPTIYFLVPDHNEPAGGIAVMYRHVDILNDNGVCAAVIHQRRGFRCTWFPNETRIVYADTARIGPQDLLVVSELDLAVLVEKGIQTPHAVLNQSGSLTWKYRPQLITKHYRDSPDLRAIITVSEYAVEFLAFAFPGRDVRLTSPSVDARVFHPGSTASNRIAFMPRRGSPEASILWHMLAARGSLREWTLEPIAGLDQHGVAEVMRRTKIFVTLSTQEGFGLPAAEAMACGVYVVGFHGNGGQRLFQPEFCSPVPSGDVLALAKRLEWAARQEEQEPGWLAQRGAAAADYVQRNYAPAQESEQVMKAYPDLLP